MPEINNRLARKVPHTHPDGEAAYSDAELRNHLIAYHGWTVGMVHQRGWSEDGAYIRGAHKHEHATAHLDPPSDHQPREW